MNYTKKSFSVLAPSGSTYADNWERTFRPREVCAAFNDDFGLCMKPFGHVGLHSRTTGIGEIVEWSSDEKSPPVEGK
jgi:hypothetical protein